MFITPIVSRIKGWSASRIFWATLIVTQIGTFFMVSAMSLLFHGVIRLDFLVTGSVTGFVVSSVIALVLSRLIQELAKLAQYDALTGLPNRTMFSECIQQGLATANRNHTKMALMFIDLDKFKPINDTYGHAVGDRVLLGVSERISDCLRNSDTAGRIGGDEFVVLLYDVGSQKNAFTIAERIRVALNQPFQVDDKTFYISSSLGIAIFPDHASDEIELTGYADIAMYQAKKSGRNNVQLFRPEMLDVQ
jgi:diguanylate cyclase (GGDEF)-like protein